MVRDFRLIKEKTTLLLGEIGAKGRPLSAVRRSELSSLSNITITSANAAGSTPTQAEFNALVMDVQAIATILSNISRSLS